MASYAPLLGREGKINWNPNLIYFNGNGGVFPTVSYEVQRLFGHNAGDRYLPSTIEGGAASQRLAVSSVRDRATGDVILKIVNGDGEPKSLQIELQGAKRIPRRADVTVLSGAADDINDYSAGRLLKPKTTAITTTASFAYTAPANSLSVVRLRGVK